MADWTIQCADRYLAVLHDYLHEKMYGYHMLKADEMPILVNRDGRPVGAKSFMWVYRAGQMYTDCKSVLYEYQKKRFLDNLLPWLPNFPANCRKPGKEVK